MNLKPLACLAFCTAAQAADSGVVTFIGSVVVPACTYSAVALPVPQNRSPVSVSKTAENARFTVALPNCGGESGMMAHAHVEPAAYAGGDGRLRKATRPSHAPSDAPSAPSVYVLEYD